MTRTLKPRRVKPGFLKFNIKSPQTYRCSWRQADRTMRYCGDCVQCGVRTYAFDDGENDPRGPLGRHASFPMHASDEFPDTHASSTKQLARCFDCGDDAEKYRRLREVLARQLGLVD